MAFEAPAGRYFIWLRGKCVTDSNLTDSVWLQFDDQIGTWLGTVHLGNWWEIQPVDSYGWASDYLHPIVIELKHSGAHRLRIQPRQTTHRIDQIWLSKKQSRIPDSERPVK